MWWNSLSFLTATITCSSRLQARAYMESSASSCRPRVGRLIEPMHRVGATAANETRFAKTPDGVYIAYQVVGSGPVDFAMDFHPFAGNVDLIWDEPDWGPFLREFTDFARLILHDRAEVAPRLATSHPRTSRHGPPTCSPSRRDRPKRPLLGAAASTGAMHALFAATHPDRTSGLFWNYPRPRLAWLRTIRGDSEPECSSRLSPTAATGARRVCPRARRSDRAAQRAGSRTTSVTRSPSTRTLCGATRGLPGIP